MFRKPEILFLLLLVLGWILPVLQSATGISEIYPRWLRHHANITHLFTHRLESWPYFEIQGRFGGGGGRWVSLRLADYSPMENYGYLTRLDRILDEAGSPERGPLIRRDLARWLADAHARIFPESPELREVRFLRVTIPVGSDLLANPDGHWIRPSLDTLPENWVREIAIVTDREWTIRAEQLQAPLPAR